MTRTCIDCGTKFDLSVAGAGETARRLARIVRYCDSCAEAAERRERAAYAAAAVRKRLHDAGLPRTLHGALWDGCRDKDAVELARFWAAGELSGLLLHGPVGVGKTWLAAAALRERCERAPTRWVSVALLFANLRRAFSDKDRAAATAVITGRGAVVLDDLDKVNPTQYAREALFAALDTRVQAGAPVLATTNLDPGEIHEHLGEAIASRLLGYCHVHGMEGGDRRMEAA